MNVLVMDLAISENVIASMDSKALIARRVFVRFCARLMVIMVAEFVTAKKAGRDQNAIFQLLNVKIQLAQTMADALRVNVIAKEDLKDLSVSNVSTLNLSFSFVQRLTLIKFSADCLDPSCSLHGSCVSGQCFCKAGWQGEDCGTVDQQVYQCLPGCSDHGQYDLETGSCVCERHWTGPDCSQAVCSLDCGPNGICDSARCRCNAGWSGALCDQKTCDPRCSAHGQCKNGSCVCSQGWNGKYCTLRKCFFFVENK